jgi:hypothetical protein
MMRSRNAITGLLMATAFLVGIGNAAAQTSGVGPYYATPSWDQTFPSAQRFMVLTNLSSAAVLDRETGLVWERTPDASLIGWAVALASCAQRSIGGRKGWRLPSIYELSSLIDPSVSSGIALPPGHPFTGFVSLGPGSFFWTSTSFSDPPLLAWAITPQLVDGAATYGKDVFSFRAWCVRSASSQAQ